MARPGRHLLKALDFGYTPLRWAAVGLPSVAFVLAATRVTHGFDDSYITYRYAWNLAHGNGLVFNPGEAILSTTTPLLAIILAAAGTAGADIPRAADFVGALALLAAAWGLAADSSGRSIARAVTAIVIFLTWPFLVPYSGGEMPLVLALAIWAFRADERRQGWLSGLLTGLAGLARPDGLLVGIVLGGRRLLQRRSLLSWALGAGLPLALWAGYSTWYFGSPLPVTLYAKRQQALMTITTSFGDYLINWTLADLAHPAHWPFWVAAALGVAFASRQARLMLLWIGLYLLGYSLLAVPRYPWYFAPYGLALAVAAAGGIAALAGFLKRWLRSQLTRQALIAISVAAVLIPAAERLPAVWMYSDPRLGPYRDVGVWLAEHTPSDASVGMLEVGITGYYARRRVVDFAGLLQPDVASQMNTASNYVDTSRWAIQRYSPDYVLLNGELTPPASEEWFTATYCPVYRVPLATDAGMLVIWAREPQ